MYIELHARSAFSFLEGASNPEALIAGCAAYGMPSMALLDRDGLYGAPRFYLAAKKAELGAHLGAEVSCVGRMALRTAGRLACRLSQSLPLDHQDETAFKKGGRRD